MTQAFTECAHNLFVNRILLILMAHAVSSSHSFSPQRPGFDPRTVHMKFVVDEVGLGQV